MKQSKPRAFAIGLLAALAMLTAGFSFAAGAQGQPTLTVMTAGGNAMCAQINQERPALTRGDQFAISAQGLSANEPVAISFTFPDGRVYSPAVTEPGGATMLDGIAQQIADPGFFGQTNAGGDYDAFFTTTNAWPRGCYRVTAQGISGSLQAAGYVVLQDAPLPLPEAGPLVLHVRSHSDLQESGVQGVTVDIYGRKFMGGETVQLRMIQPDGTIIPLPSPLVSAVGSFQTAVTLGEDRLVGEYIFVATSGNGHSQRATFTLRPQEFTPRGVALLNISNPPLPAPTVQGQTLQLQGRLFAAGEAVTIQLVQADGVVRTLATVQTSQLGEFMLDLPLNQQIPFGAHKLVARSTTALKSIVFQLNIGPGLVPPMMAVTPIVASTAINTQDIDIPADVTVAPSATVQPAASATPGAGAPNPITPAATLAASATAVPSMIATETTTKAMPETATAAGTSSTWPSMSFMDPIAATPFPSDIPVDASPLIPIDPPAAPIMQSTPIF